MSKVKVKVRMNDKIILRLNKAQKNAAQMTMEALKRKIEQDEVVPRKVGKLEESIEVKSGLLDKGKVVITYNTPYARRLYFHPEYHFSKEENANAKGLWLEDYMPGGTQENYIRDTYEKLYRRLAGL